MPSLNRFLRLYKSIISSIVMILLTIVGVFWGIVPGVKKIIEIRNHTVELTKSIQQLRSKLSILETKDEATFRDQFTQLLAAVPGDKSLPTLFATLDGLGLQSGVTLTEFSLSKLGTIASESATRKSSEEVKIGSNLLPFTIVVSGRYDQIYLFLSQVNQVRRFFRVRNFSISFRDINAISIRLSMDAFYAPLPTVLGSAETPLEPLTPDEETLIGKISQMPFLGQTAALTLPAAAPLSAPRSNLFSP